MIALQLSEDRISLTERRNQIIEGLHALPGQIKKVLQSDTSLQELATGVLANQRSLLLMGRGYQSVYTLPDSSTATNWIADTRPAWRVLSRSKKSRTCTPRVSLPVNSSTAPSL